MEGIAEPDVLDNALAGNFDGQKMQIIIRMKRHKDHDSIFEKRSKKEQEDTYDNVLTGNENIV